MIVGAASGWSQTTLNSQTPNPLYRTLFNMSILVLTVQAAGQVYERLGGSMTAGAGTQSIALAGMAVTYFLVNTIPIAIAIALSTNQNAWRIWKTDFALEPAELPPRRRRGRRHHPGGRELRLLADAAAGHPGALSHLEDVSRRARERGAAGRDSRSGERRHHHDGSAAEHPRIQSGGRTDVRLQAPGHPGPQRRPAAAARRSSRAGVGALSVHDARPGAAGRPADGVARAEGGWHRLPRRTHRRAHRLRDARRPHRLRARHHRAPRARGTAPSIAEARSHRPAGRRRGARLQQHPDEHHGRCRPPADAAEAGRGRARRGDRKSNRRSIAGRDSPVNCSPSAAVRPRRRGCSPSATSSRGWTRCFVA